MKDFVSYHNPDVMGYSASKVVDYRVVTNKNIRVAKGDRVWLIAGEGSPRSYFLKGYFYVDNVVPSQHQGFKNEIIGKRGKFFKQMISIKPSHWFIEFKKSQGNFGLGFQSITKLKYINQLEKLLNQ